MKCVTETENRPFLFLKKLSFHYKTSILKLFINKIICNHFKFDLNVSALKELILVANFLIICYSKLQFPHNKIFYTSRVIEVIVTQKKRIFYANKSFLT